MTNKEMDFIGSMNMCDEISNEAYQKIMTHCEEQEPCDDAISRQATVKKLCGVAEFLNKKREGLGSPYIMAALFIQDNKDEFPPVTPQPKIGRWEWVQYDSNPNIGNWHCSECRTIIPHMPEETDNTPIYKWCPMCGAKMEVGE